ncbi:hypothetical protein [Caballeronia sp. LZ034LL]|uniref:hypothetical protein n=1 Tax=Caballeronia sp. LZ034LL TaxID=3038567 RepID=UPI00285E78F0|nr:hypothetical protein [Caballeronia sp. LZ034LL]MDR5839316.1 hypothetical protein [Caballeronia sp. LZ034LL]
MGFFGSSSTTIVSSVVYNLAGDVSKRPDFLRSTIAGNVIGDTNNSLGESLNQAYLNGPGIRFRNFPGWAERSGYNDLIGLVTGTIQSGDTIITDQLIAQIPRDGANSVQLQASSISYADFTYWAEQYVANNHQELFYTAWTADIDKTTNLITITYENGVKESFTPANFDPAVRYLYARYNQTLPAENGPVVTGPTVSLGSTDSFPSTVGWTVVSNSGGHGVYSKTEYKGVSPDNPTRTYSVRSTMYQDTVGTSRSYRIDTQNITLQVVAPLQIFIYKFDTGNSVLDAMFGRPTNMGTFYPFIPMRIDDKFVSPTNLADVYPLAKKAFKKAMNGDFDDIIDKIADNESLGDIDYAYAVYGVALNVQDNAAKKYIYQFFKLLLDSDLTNPAAYAQWESDMQAASDSVLAYWNWYQAQGAGGNTGDTPVMKEYPQAPNYSVRVTSQNRPVMDYDMSVIWSGIEETVGSGLRPGAKKGDLWFEVNPSSTYPVYSITYGSGDNNNGPELHTETIVMEHVTLYWQETTTSWRSLDLYGLKHQNMIYGGKSVDISSVEALQDADESGFIIPLHEDIYASMSLIDATQMSTACCFLVFNCYQIVKKKWYQTGLFSVVMVVIIIAITYVSLGSGTGPAASFYAGIGTALGFTGVAAVIAGLALTMIASMILLKIVGMVATAAFGDKVGAIVTAVAAVVMIVYGSGLQNGGGFAEGLAQLTSPQNLLALTNAIGNGVVQYEQGEINDIAKQTQTMLDQYNTETKAVADQYLSTFGAGMGTINPLDLTDSSASSRGAFVSEPPSVFLNRTLMTGSDVAELNSALISQFTALTLDLDQNLAT